MGENKIPEMKPQLELIKKYSQNGKEYDYRNYDGMKKGLCHMDTSTGI